MNLIFDLDGTLLDSQPGILGSLRHTLDALGIGGRSDAEIATWIGPSIYTSFEGALRERAEIGAAAASRGRRPRDVTPQEVQAAVTAYRDHYAEFGIHDCRPFDGIHGVLETLRGGGARLYVATAKAEYLAQRMTAAWELDPLLVRVHGGKLDGTHADKGDLLGHILETEGLEAAECVMIGDRASDITGAHRHGIPALAVLWGYGSREELDGAGAVHYVERPDALPGKLDDMTTRNGTA